MTQWRHDWKHLSKTRRLVWLLALLWGALHVLGLMGTIALYPQYTRSEVRSWSDLVTYLDTADAFHHREPLYELTTWKDEMTYHYHPAYILVFSVLSGLPFRVLAMFWLFLQVGAYLGAIAAWYRVMCRLPLGEQAAVVYKAWLPLVFVFTEWYASLVYGNVTCILFLLSGLLTLAILKQRPWTASLVALPIALIKPQWLFPLLLPVVFRHWKLLLRLILGLVILYTITSGLYVVLAGPEYGVHSIHDYFLFLSRVDKNYAWQGQTGSFGEMNHSWHQILLSYFGFQSWVPLANQMIKLALIAVIGVLVVKAWRQKVTPNTKPWLVLWFAGLGYLASMAMLEQLWEILGSIVFFLWIQAGAGRTIRRVSWLFLIYAFYEIPAAVGTMTGWNWLILPQSVPLTMIGLLLLYIILVMLVYRSLSPVDEGKGILP